MEHVRQAQNRERLSAIPLAPFAANVLREWKLACPRRSGELAIVLPTRDGGIQNLANVTRRHLAPLQVAAGVVDQDGKPKYSPHSFRHFYASWLIDQGFNIKRVSALMGHSSPTVTLNIYSHLLPDEDEHERFAASERALVG